MTCQAVDDRYSSPNSDHITGVVIQERRIPKADLASQWPVMLVVFILTLVAIGGYIALMPVRYASEAVVAFQPEEGRSDGRELVSLLIQTYPEFVVSDGSLRNAASAAGVPEAMVRDNTSAEIPPLTLTMTIRTVLPQPTQAQAATQSLVDQVVSQGNVDPYLTATAISNASLPQNPAGPPRALMYAVATLLAAGLALLVGLIAARARADRSSFGEL